MNKLKNLLISTIAIVVLTTQAFAGNFGVGVSGSYANVGASGTGTEGTAADESMQAAEVSAQTAIGSVFAEYTLEGFGGMTFGLDYIPGAADVSKGLSRTDTQLDGGVVVETGKSLRTYKASAEVENHLTYYVELPIHAGLYVKGGLVQMDVNTTESGGQLKFGNTQLDGTVFGAGFKNDLGTNAYYKVEGTHQAFDTLNLTSTDGVGATVNRTVVKADLDVTKITFALGYKF